MKLVKANKIISRLDNIKSRRLRAAGELISIKEVEDCYDMSNDAGDFAVSLCDLMHNKGITGQKEIIEEFVNKTVDDLDLDLGDMWIPYPKGSERFYKDFDYSEEYGASYDKLSREDLEDFEDIFGRYTEEQAHKFYKILTAFLNKKYGKSIKK